MWLGSLLWLMAAFILIISFSVALILGIWWLWRKITLPSGAPPPKWTDLSALKKKSHCFPIVIRLIVISLLGLIMSAPIDMIYDLIRERSQNYRSVVQELTRSWGGQQLLLGPVLTVPYTIEYELTETVALTEKEINDLRRRRMDTPQTAVKEVKKIKKELKTAVILPKNLRIEGVLDPELRHRGIYSMRVYTADLRIAGKFEKIDFNLIDKRFVKAHWDQAQLLVNLSDMKSFRGNSPLILNEKEFTFVPGTKGSPVAPIGFSAGVDLSDIGEKIDFSFTIKLGGSQGFFIAPNGENNFIKISSSWPHPKYWGDGLPTRREHSDEGFLAEWEVPNLVRNYPQFADISDMGPVTASSRVNNNDDGLIHRSNLRLAEYVVGVDLFEPVFHYSILTRAVKYAMMFLALTFLSVFIFEVSTSREGGPRLHLAQYGIIGLGLCLFYLVLLAVSEQMSFGKAYLLASFINIAMIAGYIKAALKQNKAAVVAGLILLALYSALFFILRMEEYSLLSGTTLLVLALISLMHVTRNLSASSKQIKEAEEGGEEEQIVDRAPLELGEEGKKEME